MRADWVDKNPKAAKALLMAVMEAQQWCDQPENRKEMAEICSKREYFKAPAEVILGRASGNIDYGNGRVVENSPYLMKFWQDNTSYPFQSHDLWFLTEAKRWGYYPTSLDADALVKKVNREDMWRDAAKSMNVAAADIPKTTSRGVETFFDGVKFDPEKPDAYLKGLKIKATKA
jgi:nitrate/nitrite transport system substrate-binding protein